MNLDLLQFLCLYILLKIYLDIFTNTLFFFSLIPPLALFQIAIIIPAYTQNHICFIETEVSYLYLNKYTAVSIK